MPPETREVPMDRPYSRIACCIDNDGMAEDVLREGIRLADGALGALNVVHVIAPPHALIASPYAYIAPAMELRDDAEAWLEEVTRGIPEATTVLLEGFPAREVCAWARSSGVDLIVAAARRGLLERTMLGGFASHIAYHASCPVLLVHPPAERPATAGATEGATGSSTGPRKEALG
jgi:nucleotide-binding universal stress UspA family protein